MAVYLLGGLCILSGYFAIPSHARSGELDLKVALYLAVNAFATIAIAVGIWRHKPKSRLPWVLLFVNQLIYTLGDVAFYVRTDLWKQVNYPSISDVLYLGHYLPLIAALAIIVHKRRVGRDRSAALEGAILACGLGLVMWIFLIAPQVHAVGETPIAKFVSILYPMMDVAVLALAMQMIVDKGRRNAAFYVLVGALLLLLSTDALYGIQQLNGTFTSGNFLDGMWAGYYLLIGAVALHPSMQLLAEPNAQQQPSAGKSRLIGLAVASLMAPASLVIQFQRHAPLDVEILAGGAAAMFLLVLARMWLLVTAQEVAAVTDSLTDLYNRRFLEEQIRLEGARHIRSGQPLAMFMLDIDHFKSVNDTYGHPVGDQVLREVARRIRVGARRADVVARFGGEEFAILAPGLDDGSLVAVAERLRAAVAERPIEVGPDAAISVTVSIGVASLPLHTSRPDELITLADRALYGAKQAGRNRILIGSTQVPAPRPAPSKLDVGSTLLEFLCRVEDEMEGYQAPNEHSSAVGRWAGIVAFHAGFDAESRVRCEISGRLHDIGKIVVPREILAKSDPLTAEEWRIVSMHADHGSRLLTAFGANEATAQVVAQHHERYDGKGYPAGLRRDEIRIEARVLAICDSWAAMRVDRHYRRALSLDEALEQLRLGRGGQFDPDLDDLFMDLVDQGIVGEIGQLGGIVPLLVDSSGTRTLGRIA